MASISKSKLERFFALSKEESVKLQSLLESNKIERVATSKLVPYFRNVKAHPAQQIDLLAEGIRRFGFTNPILIDEADEVIAGHARLEAAKQLQLPEVPAIRLTHLNAQEKRGLRIADNKLSELGTWDLGNLKLELKDLTIDSGDLSFDPLVLGFETVEIDRILDDGQPDPKHDPADDFPTIATNMPAVSQPGDVWVCGRHLLVCGDATQLGTYEQLLGRERAAIVFTDPPYNVPNKGHVSSRADVREFAMASGDLTSEQFIDFLRTISERIRGHVQDGAVMYICMDWRQLPELDRGTYEVLGTPKNMIVWAKTNAGMGTFYRSQHELIAVFVAGNVAATNNFKLGARGRYRSNVWRYPGMNSFGRGRDATLALHPTVKPVALVVDALRDCSRRGDTVLDPFGGSGTTIIAAEKTGRLARLIEIDPLYCDTIVRRWQAFTKLTAVLASTNQTFDDAALLRVQVGASEEGDAYVEGI